MCRFRGGFDLDVLLLFVEFRGGCDLDVLLLFVDIAVVGGVPCRRCLTWWLGVVGRDLFGGAAAPVRCRGAFVFDAAMPRCCGRILYTAEPGNTGRCSAVT